MIQIAKYIMLAWFLVVLLIASNQHGKPRKGDVNFWVDFGVVAVQVIVLAIGGFFK